MENPATWSAAEKVIARALDDHQEAQAQDLYGPSLERRIAGALRSAGLLKEEETLPDTPAARAVDEFLDDPSTGTWRQRPRSPEGDKKS